MFMVMLILMVPLAPVFLDCIVQTKYQQMSHAVSFFFFVKVDIFVSWHFVRLNWYGSQTVAVKHVKKSGVCIYGNIMFLSIDMLNLLRKE
jgi:hypothetical protein